MAWTFCTSQAAIYKAGENVDSTVKASSAILASFSNQAEAVINAETDFDWIANYSSIGTNFKQVLGEAASSLIAVKMINYNMSGFTSRFEATTMMDVNYDLYSRVVSIIKDSNVKRTMGAT